MRHLPLTALLSGCVSAEAIDGKGVLGEIGDPPSPSDLYDDGSAAQPASEPSGEPADEWTDTGLSIEPTIWSCQSSDFNLCWGLSSEVGWDEGSAEAGCGDLEFIYEVSIDFMDGACPIEGSVGECAVAAGLELELPVLLVFYEGDLWDSSSAEDVCSNYDGEFN